MANKVALMGASLFTGNRGVSALAASLVKLICDARPDSDISLMIGNRTSLLTSVELGNNVKSVRVTNYRLSPRARLQEQLWWIVVMAFLYKVLKAEVMRKMIARSTPWIQAAAQADFVGDIRGGDSFSDIYGVRNFLIGSVEVLTVLWVRGRIHLFPQTYGPFRSALAERFARHILLRAETILCRDQVSVAEVERLTGGRRKGTFCPDVAFELESIRPEATQIEAALPSGDGTQLIGINVNGLVYHGGYTRANMFGLKLDYREFLKRAVEQFLSDPSARVLLVPHTFAGPQSVESDPAACREVKAAVSREFRDRVHIVTAEYDQNRIKGVIGMCDFFVGSRMHACIAALSQGIPTVGVAYSRKFHGVFETVGMADSVIDGRAEDVESALGRVADLYDRRLASRDALCSNVASARAELKRRFTELFSA